MHQKPKLPLKRINPGPHAQKGMHGYKSQVSNPKPIEKGTAVKSPTTVATSTKPATSKSTTKATHPGLHNQTRSAIPFKKIAHPKPVGATANGVNKVMRSGTRPTPVLKAKNEPRPVIARQIAKKGNQERVGELRGH